MRISARVERFPIAGGFRIARGAKREAVVVVCEARDADGRSGWGEAVPYTHFGESVDSVLAVIEELDRASLEGALLDRVVLQERLLPGAARNAVDCALWDLASRQSARPVHELAGLDAPRPVATCFTLSLDAPDAVEASARRERGRPWLKLKLGGDALDGDRVAAARQGAPEASLVVDANESWNRVRYEALMPTLAACGVSLVEQPFPQRADEALATLDHPVPVCADESCRDRAGLEALVGRYDVVNVKLDKAGGLTEALQLVARARELGLGVMVGCMVSSSLSIAPAMLLAAQADVVDLDGALLLERDRPGGVTWRGGLLHPSESLWGMGTRNFKV